jgi:large subunit ribosomal protein L29
MKAAHLREKSDADLRELEKTLGRDVFRNRLKNFTNQLDDTSAARKAKRELARVLTILAERGKRNTGAAPAGEGTTTASEGSRNKGEASQS